MKRLSYFISFTLFFLLSSVHANAISLKVGETYTCTLSSPPRYLQGCQWTTSRPSEVQIVSTVSSLTTSVTVKALKSFTGSPCVIQCKYYYLELDPTTGRYTYSRSGSQEWNFFVSEVKPTGVNLSRSSMSLNVGESEILTASLVPSDAQSSFSWSSSSKDVATISIISETRVEVVACGPGECSVMVSTGSGHSASCRVTVNSTDPTSISMTQSSLTLTANQSKKLSYTLYPSNSKSVVTWSCEDEEIATVSQSGIVTGKKQGQTYVYAKTSNGLSTKAIIKVYPAVESISLKPTDIYEGYCSRLTYTCVPNGLEPNITWHSSDVSVASVDANGVVTAKKEGSTVISAVTDNNKKSEVTIRVIKPESILNIRNARLRLSVVQKMLERKK